MDSLQADLTAAVTSWEGRGWARPIAWVVSGSGLAVDLLPELSRHRVALQEILPFELHSIAGHPLSLELIGARGTRPVAYQRGRIHTYQGYDAAQTVFHVRLAALLGVEALIMTNAAGSLVPHVLPGDLVAIKDHINFIGSNPLTGSPPEDWGPRFPDMTAAYDPELRRRARGVAAELGFDLTEGVYAGVPGPSYETPAEIRMLKTLGADLVGMSTVLEVIAASHMDLRCLCLSMVANHAAGIGDGLLEHAEVLQVGRSGADRLRELLELLLSDWIKK